MEKDIQEAIKLLKKNGYGIVTPGMYKELEEIKENAAVRNIIYEIEMKALHFSRLRPSPAIVNNV